MAFGKGNVVTESEIQRFIGVTNFTVHGVNLSKEELSKLYGREVTNDQIFTREVEINGVKYPGVNIVFTLSYEFDGVTRFVSARYPLIKTPVVKSDGSKVKVIDSYGRTAWVTEEEYKNHTIPVNSNGPANISPDYTPMYRGQEALTLFVKNLLGLPNVDKWEEVDGVRKIVGLIDNPSSAECKFDNFDKIFAGDVSEVRTVLGYNEAGNKIKLAMGVRKDDQNRLWQDIFVDFPMKANLRNLSPLSAAIEDAQKNGRYPNTTFEVCDLKLYTETPTNFASFAGNTAVPVNTPGPAEAVSPWFKG